MDMFDQSVRPAHGCSGHILIAPHQNLTVPRAVIRTTTGKSLRLSRLLASSRKSTVDPSSSMESTIQGST